MKNNKKFLFFTVALLVLLVGLGAASAASMSDNNTLQSAHTDTHIASGDVQVAGSDTAINKVKKTDTVKDIKTDKKIKKDNQTTKIDKTQSVSDYSSLEKSWNDIQSNGDNETDYVINVRNGEYDFTDELTTGNATPKSVTVNGEDVDKTIFNGNGVTRFFNLNSSSQNIKFTNITFINGFDSSNGGAVYSNATLDIDSCKFINNSAINNRTVAQGGALKTIGNTTITNSSFINNTARIANVNATRMAYGGAISHAVRNHYSIINITLCEFIGNREYTDNTGWSFGGYGGAIYCLDRSSSYITYSTFINNTAVNTGGAIYINKIYNDTPCTVSNNYFEGNTASSNNDTYYSRQGDISNSIFSSNYQTTTPKENKVILLVNDKLPALTLTQKTSRLTVKLINEDKFEDAEIDGIGKNYEAPVTSSSNLINTSNLSLSRDNHYTATFNLTSLPANHEDIVLYVDGAECAVIKWDYTNVVFNNITGKPGETVTLSAAFTTSDGKLIPSGSVAFKINGKTVGHSNIKIGTASLNYTIPDNYSIKDYLLTVTYGGSSKFIGTQTNSTLTLNKYDATMTLDNVSANPGDNILLRASLTTPSGTPVNSGKAVFKLNGKTLKDNNGNSTVRVHNGTAVLNYTIPSNYSAKNYKLSAVSVGNNYNRVEASSNLTLNKINTNIRVNNITLNGNSLKVNATINNIKTGNVASERSNKVSVKIDKHTVIKEVKINNGIINLNTTVNTRNGVHTVEIVTSGNNIYNSARINTTVEKTSNLKQSIKKQDAVSSYYVSADSGSDTNTGSQTSPFKTIAHAISTVNSTRSSANIYLNGTFKGTGNTNLTVPGDLHINFIGVGNSSIDGEVNYTIKEKLDDGEYYWNSGRIWWPYNNATGNWAMNITKGNGLITISNLTIKNCWSRGGSDISAYPTATIDNYGNLEVDNASFIFNHAGVGAGIRNNANSTLTVVNSLFEGNRKSSTTGNFGAGIYNNGTATIINSTFRNNYARWGSVTNDRTLTIINSTIRDNIAYDGGSSYKFGSGIAINTRSGSYFSDYDVVGIVTVIDGCTFINNDQLDVYADAGNLNLTNSVFNRSTGVNVPRENGNYTIKYNIVNNTFISPIGSTLFNSLSSTEKTTFALKIQNAYTYNIENNTILNVTGTYSKSIELSSTANINYATIKNNIADREIYVKGEYNNITGNNVTTKVDTYAVNLVDGGNNTVRGNYLVSKSFQGDNAVNYTQSSTVVENNTPETKLITIDDSTYNRYFENSTLKANYNSIDEIQVVGSLTNKNFIFNKNINFFQTDKKITSYNITVTGNGQIESTGLIIENTNHEPVFILNSNGNSISNTNLKTNNNHTIIITGTNNTVTGNELVADMLVGNDSVEAANGNNVTLNTPTYINYILSEDTYSQYFDENGYIRTLNNTRDIHFLVKGPVTNKNINLNNNKTVTITGYDNSILYNTTITTLGSTSLNMTYITVNNTNSKPAVILNTPVNTISSNNIITNTNAIEVNNAADLTIEYNNITANSTDTVKTILIKDSKGTLNIIYNNINTTGQAAEITNTTSSIEILNTSQLVLSDNNITTTYSRTTGNDTIISVNMVNPEINITDLDTTGINYNEISDNNIYTYGNTNAVGINYVNQTVYTDDGTITTEAKNNAIGTRFVSSKARHYYRYGSITIYGLEDITFKSDSPGSQIVLIDSQNMRIYNNDITASSNNTNGIILYNTVNTTVQNNRINTQGTPAELDNSTQTNITRNVMITTGKYSIIIMNTSTKNIVTDNVLYAADELADNSVAKLNSNNRVRLNNPGQETYLYLRDDTYNDYFDENGRLRNEIPVGTTIRLTDDLHNKVLNITHPINIISDSTEYIDCVMIIDEKAAGTNITGARFTGENPGLIVNADNTKLNIVDLIASNTQSSNLTPLIVNGNNNNITITGTIAVYSTSSDLNSNTTLMTVNGNNNYIDTNYNRAENMNNVTIILLNNTENNTIKMGWLNTDPNIYNQAVFINSNYNKLNIRQADVRGNIFTGINMQNSSYNKFGYTSMSGAAAESTQILIMKNSDSNSFEELRAFKNWGNTVQNTPVRLENSNNNTFYRCSIQYPTYDGYAMIINESVGNLVEYNQLETRTLKGDDTVLQENVNDTINNIVRYNYATAGRTPVFTVNTTDIIKVLDTITITGNATYRNGSYRSPLIPVTQGTVTYKVNGVEIGTVDVTDGITSINYTVTGNEGSVLQIEATYKDPTQTFGLQTATVTRNITKINTGIRVGNITNNGRNAILTAIVTDENKDIVDNGVVTFSIDGKNVSKTSIENGAAILTVDASKYNAGNHNITAKLVENNIYNSISGNGTLTITRYNAAMTIEEVNARPGETVTFRVYLTDNNGNPINSGKVIFKLNGKTLKDANGSTITVRVHNGIALLNYTIPAGYSAKNYTLTAVSVGNTYNRVEASTNITLSKIDSYITGSAAVTGNTLIVNSSIHNSLTGNVASERSCKVSVKLDGHTVIKEVRISNGVINLNTTLTNIKYGVHNVEIVTSGNSIYNNNRINMTVVKV